MSISFDTTIALRPAEEADRDFLYEVFCSTRPDVMQATLSPEQLEQFLRMQFRAQDSHYRTHYPEAKYNIIVLNDQCIGRLYLARMESEFRILDIALMPEFRSKGIGTYLVRRVLNESHAAEKPLRIHVARDSREYHFYERLGFHQIGDLKSHLFMECKPN